MKDMKLEDFDPGDIEDLLSCVEDSFNIHFSANELAYAQTFGEMCDHIKGKIRLDLKDDCTSQQAFYKLRNILITSCQIDKENIAPNTLLEDLFPKQTRQSRIKQLEKGLGFKLVILRPSYTVMGFLTIFFLASLIQLIFSLQLGLLGTGLSVIGLWITSKTGKEFHVQTVGQLAEKISRENYLKSRRNPKTYNDNEIEKVLIDWFSNEFGIDKSKLTRQSRLP